jgi:hypothetical protein
MRECRSCGESKPLMDFYSQTNGSITRKCKTCTCRDVRANRLAKIDQYTEYERGRANLPHRVDARREYARTPAGRSAGNRGKRAYIERNPIKQRAHYLCGNAIRDGRLIRQPCEVCGNTKAQAHHDDYGKPLDVRWLCTTHHADWHRHNTPKCPSRSDLAA